MIKKLFLVFIGFSGGIITSAGLCALITFLGILPRLSVKTGTKSYLHMYEMVLLLGVSLGNCFDLFMQPFRVSYISYMLFLFVYGTFAGVFTGCLIMGLAEISKVFSTLLCRINVSKKIGIIVVCFAIGKLIGSLWMFMEGF